MYKIFDFFKQIFNRKTIYRILFNWQVKENCRNLTGEVLDLASGKNPSYYQYLPKQLRIKKADYYQPAEQAVDFNQTLPFNDNSFDQIFFFNSLYIVKNHQVFFKEINRLLKPTGQLFLATPFIANEMPEPNDYSRLTYEGLVRELQRAGFNNFKIIRFGERFSSAAHLLHDFWFLNVIRLIIYSLALLFDRLIPKKLRKLHPCPLGYFCIINKT